MEGACGKDSGSQLRVCDVKCAEYVQKKKLRDACRVSVRAHRSFIWVVVKMRVPFWFPVIIRHLIFRAPKRDHNFDNHPFG